MWRKLPPVNLCLKNHQRAARKRDFALKMVSEPLTNVISFQK